MHIRHGTGMATAFIMCIVIICGISGPSCANQSWNLANDWQTQNNTIGPWIYGCSKDTVTLWNNGFDRVSTDGTSWYGWDNIIPGTIPFIAKATSDGFWGAPNWPKGVVGLHDGSDDYHRGTGAKWIAPEDMIISLSGGCWQGMNADSGRQQAISLVANGEAYFRDIPIPYTDEHGAKIDQSNQFTLAKAMAAGGGDTNRLQYIGMRKGDSLWYVARDYISCHFVCLDFTINRVDATAREAKAGGPGWTGCVGGIVTAVFPDYDSYVIESGDRSSAITVRPLGGQTLAIGNIVAATGTVQGDGTLWCTQPVATNSIRNLGPLGVSNRSIIGTSGAAGLNNADMLVKTWGRVLDTPSVLPDSSVVFHISDGALGQNEPPVQVVIPPAIKGTGLVVKDDFVAVTGIVGRGATPGDNSRVVIVRGGDGIAPMASTSTRSADIVVAAKNSSSDCKAQADFVCDGVRDEIELLQSITCANMHSVDVDVSPTEKRTVTCYGRHSVRWLPGDYYLDTTLTIPNAADMAINAEGAYLHYRQATGNAVVINGMLRCRYKFGTIENGTTGAALCARPTSSMPQQMSEVSFTGLVGHNQRGIGLNLDNSMPSGINCTNKWECTDIAGFDIGVYVSDAVGRCYTNWFWFSFIRECNTCIWEKQQNIDSNIWNVNVDASLLNSIAIRTGAVYGRWLIIMGVAGGTGTKGILLDPGARDNTFEVPQRRSGIGWTWVDNSGNTTNRLITP